MNLWMWSIWILEQHMESQHREWMFSDDRYMTIRQIKPNRYQRNLQRDEKHDMQVETGRHSAKKKGPVMVVFTNGKVPWHITK